MKISGHEASLRLMPDVATHAGAMLGAPLDWVGMGEIEVPIRLVDDEGAAVTSGARAAAFVNLRRPEIRGIHMSRLYRLVDETLSAGPLTPAALRAMLEAFLESHRELSDRAMLRVRFDYMIRRPALMSDNSGWKSYPVVVTGVLDRDGFSLELGFEAYYSSTCPSSAALARQLIQERFGADFMPGDALDRTRVMEWLGSEQGICATPHSQRSAAEVRARVQTDLAHFPIRALLDRVEGALKTAVQTAVKREDEQAFALLNAANLMFCEDAARRIRAALAADATVSDFWLRASHYESLHPHNAVAVATKGVPGGYAAGLDWMGHLRV